MNYLMATILLYQIPYDVGGQLVGGDEAGLCNKDWRTL